MSGRPSTAASSGTAELILDAAERRAQRLGFNGFSYADVAGELGVTAASIHYHFPSKADLGERMIERYTARLLQSFADFDKDFSDPWRRLQAYVGLYEVLVSENKLCLCCMLAAEHQTLPEMMQERLREFFDLDTRWVAAQITATKNAGGSSEAQAAAAALIGALQGAALVARANQGVNSFRASARFTMESFRAALAR